MFCQSMEENNLSVDQFISRFHPKSNTVEHVADIVVENSQNAQKHYGISVRGDFDYEDERIPVIGYVVLDPGSGKPNPQKSEFIGFVKGLIKTDETKTIISDQKAVEAMKKIYNQHYDYRDMCIPRFEAEIGSLDK